MEQPDSSIYSNDSMTFLLCPYCRREIPLMTLTIVNNDILITIKCSCESIKTSSNTQMKLTEYMFEMRKERKIKGKCSQHQRRYIKYCPDCFTYLCHECLSAHCLLYSQHNCLIYNYINVNCLKHRSKYVKYCSECNVNFCCYCLSLHSHHWGVIVIDSVSKTLKHQSLAQLYYKLKKILESTNENNSQYNQKEFTHWLFNAWYTVVIFQHYPSFQIMSLLNHIMLFIERISLKQKQIINKSYSVLLSDNADDTNINCEEFNSKDIERIEQSTYYSDYEMDIE